MSVNVPETESGGLIWSETARVWAIRRVQFLAVTCYIGACAVAQRRGAPLAIPPDPGNGGQGWIRTSVRLRGQIYSLLPLTTRPPVQMAGRTSRVAARQMAALGDAVNAEEGRKLRGLSSWAG